MSNAYMLFATTNFGVLCRYYTKRSALFQSITLHKTMPHRYAWGISTVNAVVVCILINSSRKEVFMTIIVTPVRAPTYTGILPEAQ